MDVVSCFHTKYSVHTACLRTQNWGFVLGIFFSDFLVNKCVLKCNITLQHCSLKHDRENNS